LNADGIASSTHSGTACGKAILLGEHAVVYGVPALAVGIERGVRAVARPAPDGVSRLLVPTWGADVTEDDPVDLGRALRALLLASGVEGRVAVEAVVELPPGGGLGCSAALGVAVARALDPAASPGEIAERVMAWERIFHGSPSGVDAAVASHGGCVAFSRGEGIAEVRVGAPLTLCVGKSGAASSTARMVASVAAQKADRPEEVSRIFDGIRSLVQGARAAVESGDRSALGRLMDLNQIWLTELELSTPALDRLCGLARDHGALGAKLTGAGGGGCALALVASGRDAWQVLDAWRGAGFEGFVTRVASSRSFAAPACERAAV